MNERARVPVIPRRLSLLALFVVMLTSQPALSKPKVLINSHTNDIVTIDSAYLSQIFAMQVKKWPNGQPIQVITLPSNDNLHRQFVIERLQIQPHQLDRIWNRMLFTGTGKPPTVVSSEDDMLKVIQSNPGAVGYTSEEYPTDGVELVKEIQP